MDLIPGNRYLFDTSVYIDLIRKRKAGIRFHHQVRFLRIAAGYSVVTETELWMGIIGLRTVAQHVQVLRPYKRYFVNVTIARDAGLFWGQFYHIQKLRDRELPGIQDCIIAATARFYGLRLVSKNTDHMSKFVDQGVIVDEYVDEE